MQPAAPSGAFKERGSSGPLLREQPRSISALEIQVYRACDQLSEGLIYLMLLFSPWAFGTTQAWSIWTMNFGGYVLGVLLGIKWIIRSWRGYHPARWGQAARSSAGREPLPLMTASRITSALAILTMLFLVYCLISALNARATFQDQTLAFVYRDCIRWLPHSLDSIASWSAFRMYFGLACFFWALRDWLLGKSDGEERAQWQKSVGKGPGAAPPMPQRLRRLLWLLALNGALLGVESILQRAADSPRLLFVLKPRIHQTADGQFGPYAYRSNAAQYFNLLWPVCLGFWWTLNRNFGAKRKAHHMVLFAAALMAACPLVSTSRAGAIVDVLMAILAALGFGTMHLLDSSRRSHTTSARTFRGLTLFFAGALALGLVLGLGTLKPRLTELNFSFAEREQMYAAARPMAADYPWFGTGPGTFETVSHLYPKPDIFWPAQLHNDWLETRITFGWVGSALVALALCCTLVRWGAPGGIHGGRRFVLLTWLALGGCLLHARFDFPFQIHSILLVFLVWCAVLSTLSGRTKMLPG